MDLDFVAELRGVLGPEHVLEGDAIGPRYSQDLWGVERRGDPRLVLRPGDTAEVSAVLRLCHQARRPVVPQGGMTGLVGAGLPDSTEVVLSLERMNRIDEVDTATRTMTVQAGATLQAVQDRAAIDDLQFPLDLASRGSCTIGGCLATNAGGNRVLQHGTARDLTLGVEAVLADGTVIHGLRKLVKNNTGYDLKHLFVGSEGTLGVITGSVLRLRPRAARRYVAFCGLASAHAAVALLNRLQGLLPGMISAFEGIWDNAYALVKDGPVRLPLPPHHPMYVLLECEDSDRPGSDRSDAADRFIEAMDACAQFLDDAVIGTTESEIKGLWAVREQIPAEVLRMDPLIGFDVSLPGSGLDPFLAELIAGLRQRWPAARLVTFGHLGDGNVHIAVVTGSDTPHADKPFVEDIVYATVAPYAGSISGEHGIGFEKRPYLHYSRTPAEIELMRTIKRALDPLNILNPGRVFDVAGSGGRDTVDSRQ